MTYCPIHSTLPQHRLCGPHKSTRPRVAPDRSNDKGLMLWRSSTSKQQPSIRLCEISAAPLTQFAPSMWPSIISPTSLGLSSWPLGRCVNACFTFFADRVMWWAKASFLSSFPLLSENKSMLRIFFIIIIFYSSKRTLRRSGIQDKLFFSQNFQCRNCCYKLYTLLLWVQNESYDSFHCDYWVQGWYLHVSQVAVQLGYKSGSFQWCYIEVMYLFSKNLVSKSASYLCNLSWQWCAEVLYDWCVVIGGMNDQCIIFTNILFYIDHQVDLSFEYFLCLLLPI